MNKSEYTSKITIPDAYWSGKGRKIIVIPFQLLKTQIEANALLKSLHITEIGYYPNAAQHYTHRQKGSKDNILIYCTKGEGWVKLRGESYIIKPNNFIILPKNIEHEYGASTENPWTIYWTMFGGTGISELNEFGFTQLAFQPKAFRCHQEALKLFDDMFTVLESGYSTQYIVYVNMQFCNFLTLFLFQNESIVKKNSSNHQTDIVQKAISYMQLNLTGTVTISALSNAAGCSVSKLSNVFKLNTGHTPIDYFNLLKIQKACQSLYSTNKLVKEIALELGFSDQYYFSRLFTKLMGISPNNYRSRNTV
ncbi:AraC family transcriptional regulator [Sphingobacterium luzhongxinii]|uniref:AraC family transcriptional regulator n=1 Tax=Sphingobacterium luzhongxinii TaxID=2654181 RepID=UPI0013DB20A5|nr:AraC family transcriptional regulator [Sphingobacterium sp. xlx-73]